MLSSLRPGHRRGVRATAADGVPVPPGASAGAAWQPGRERATWQGIGAGIRVGCRASWAGVRPRGTGQQLLHGGPAQGAAAPGGRDSAQAFRCAIAPPRQLPRKKITFCTKVP